MASCRAALGSYVRSGDPMQLTNIAILLGGTLALLLSLVDALTRRAHIGTATTLERRSMSWNAPGRLSRCAAPAASTSWSLLPPALVAFERACSAKPMACDDVTRAAGHATHARERAGIETTSHTGHSPAFHVRERRPRSRSRSRASGTTRRP